MRRDTTLHADAAQLKYKNLEDHAGEATPLMERNGPPYKTWDLVWPINQPQNEQLNLLVFVTAAKIQELSLM